MFPASAQRYASARYTAADGVRSRTSLGSWRRGTEDADPARRHSRALGARGVLERTIEPGELARDASTAATRSAASRGASPAVPSLCQPLAISWATRRGLGRRTAATGLAGGRASAPSCTAPSTPPERHAGRAAGRPAGAARSRRARRSSSAPARAIDVTARDGNVVEFCDSGHGPYRAGARTGEGHRRRSASNLV